MSAIIDTTHPAAVTDGPSTEACPKCDHRLVHVPKESLLLKWLHIKQPAVRCDAVEDEATVWSEPGCGCRNSYHSPH